MSDPLFTSIKGTTRELGGISVATVYRMFERGQLEKVKIGGRTMVTTRSIRALLEAA